MSWGTLRWWLLGAVAYLVFMASMLPASYLLPRLLRSHPEVQLGGVSGTFWSGDAMQLNLRGMPLGAVHWRFDWLALLSLSFGMHVDLSGDASLSGRVDARGTSLFLRSISGRVPMAMLDQWLPLPPHSLSGSLRLDLKRVTLKDGKLVDILGEVDLEDASLSWPSSMTLGSFAANLAPDPEGGMAAHINDLQSPLKLQADLTYASDGAYHLSGLLSPKETSDTATRDLLNGLGPGDSTGQHHFDFKGQW